jgi:hypothetical protein
LGDWTLSFFWQEFADHGIPDGRGATRIRFSKSRVHKERPLKEAVTKLPTIPASISSRASAGPAGASGKLRRTGPA